jgi:hypothetical protein
MTLAQETGRPALRGLPQFRAAWAQAGALAVPEARSPLALPVTGAFLASAAAARHAGSRSRAGSRDAGQETARSQGRRQ